MNYDYKKSVKENVLLFLEICIASIIDRTEKIGTISKDDINDIERISNLYFEIRRINVK